VSTTPNSVVVVGSINVDQLITVVRHPLPGETLMATSMRVLPGGKGANQAVAAARLGASVSMVGMVGNDLHAPVALALMTSAGVDVSRVGVAPGATGLAVVSVADDGENTIVVIPGTNEEMGADAVHRSASIISSAAIVVLQGEIPAAGIEAAAALCAGRLVLNLAPVIAVNRATILKADPLVVNEHEAVLVLAQLDPEAPTGLSDTDLMARLKASGCASVVMTVGARGALCAVGAEILVIPSPHVVAVDSSGAGDAFVGAMSAVLASGQTLLEAVSIAVRVGAFAVQGRGTQPSYPFVHDKLPEVAA
jgi:ribokinase